VLEKFILGRKEKTGNRDIILELGMKLLKKENGVLIPSGYIGNKNKTYTELRKFILQYKVLGIFELPKHVQAKRNEIPRY
jgi:hypothetical protein